MQRGRLPIAHHTNASRASARSFPSVLPRETVAAFVLEAPREAVHVLAHIDAAALLGLLEAVDPGNDIRRALLVPLQPAATAEALVEQIVGFLAATAARVWPIWYTDFDFSNCTPDRLGRLAAGILARTAAKKVPGASPLWAERAAPLALAGSSIRASSLSAAVEIAQLALAINRGGLTLVVEASAAIAKGTSPDALVRALEWTANCSGSAVVALFDELPASEPPLDRILFDARTVASTAPNYQESTDSDDVGKGTEPWLAPWRGRPHPMSDIETRLAAMLCADVDLGPLFAFNQTVETVRGSTPKVDLLWKEGRLVVEIDGYESHGNRRAFLDDRHRDYELTLSGYTVLRLPNDEIVQDLEKAVDKIRDLVRMRRTLMSKES